MKRHISHSLACILCILLAFAACSEPPTVLPTSTPVPTVAPPTATQPPTATALPTNTLAPTPLPPTPTLTPFAEPAPQGWPAIPNSLYFIWGGALHRWARDGSGLQTVYGQGRVLDYAVAPGETHILLRLDRPPSLAVLKRSDCSTVNIPIAYYPASAARWLMDDHVHDMALTPDGRYVVYIAWNRTGRSGTLRLVNTQTPDQKRGLAYCREGCRGFTMAPNGQYLVFADANLWLVTLPYGSVRQIAEGTWVPGAWTNDGRRLIVSRPDEGHGSKAVFDLVTGKFYPILGASVSEHHDMTWSADGQHIIASLPRDNGPYLQRISATDPAQVTALTEARVFPNPPEALQWLPNGDLGFIYRHTQADSPYPTGLYRLPATGGEPRLLAPLPESDSQTVKHIWSLDGRMYMYLTSINYPIYTPVQLLTIDAGDATTGAVAWDIGEKLEGASNFQFAPPETATLEDSLPAPDNATRIQFAPGTTSAELSGDFTPDTVEHYVLYALAGQTLQLRNAWNAGDVPPDLRVAIRGADGTLLAEGDLAAVHNITLPSSQDYYISIQTSASYLLNVTIPPSNTSSDCPFSEDILRNATYTVGELKFQLVDGEAELPQVVPGDPEKNRHSARYAGLAGCGDLNGDGVAEALVVLSTHTENTTGYFKALAVVLNEDGEPHNVATSGLGDRVVIARCDQCIHPSGKVEVNIMSEAQTWSFRFTGDALIRCMTQFDTLPYPQLDIYLRMMGIQLCIPTTFGTPQITDYQDPVKIDFEGENTRSIMYATYRNSPYGGMLYAIPSDDYWAVQNGTKENMIEHDGVKGFIYLKNLEVLQDKPSAIRVFIFPFPEYYIAVEGALLDFASSEALTQAWSQLLAHPYPEAQRAQLELQDQLLEILEFQPYRVAPEICDFWRELAWNFTSVGYIMNESKQFTGLHIVLERAVDMPEGWIVSWEQADGTLRAEYGPWHVEPSEQRYSFHAPPPCVSQGFTGGP